MGNQRILKALCTPENALCFAVTREWSRSTEANGWTANWQFLSIIALEECGVKTIDFLRGVLTGVEIRASFSVEKTSYTLDLWS